MPKFEFCQPVAKASVPDGPDWLHEVKYDGYRGRVVRDGKDVRIGLDWTWRFPWIAETARIIRKTRFMIDGEICVLDVHGIPDFNALHSNQHNEEAHLYAFDLVGLDGEDLRELPLFERKKRLGKVLLGHTEGIFAAPFERGEIGPALFGAACEMKLEGIVSKPANGLYRPRTCGWVKVKNREHPAFSRVKESYS